MFGFGRTRHLGRVLLVASIFLLPGCGGDDEPPYKNWLPNRFLGVYADSSDGGRVDLTVLTPNGQLSPATRPPPPNAHGTLSPSAGGVVDVAGFYREFSLDLSGEGYTVSGHYVSWLIPPYFAGSTIGPSGFGILRCSQVRTDTAAAYCATFQSEAALHTGRLNFVLAENVLHGAAFGNGDSAGYYLVGGTTGSGPTRTIIFDGAFDLAHHFSGTGTLFTATGVVQGRWAETLSGAPTDSGSWSGGECPVGSAGPN